MTATLAKLKKFVNNRHRSGHTSNLQFQIDCEAAGMKLSDLRNCRKGRIGNLPVYRWDTDAGEIAEIAGRLVIVNDPAKDMEGWTPV